MDDLTKFDQKLQKYIICILCGAIGDAIGYYNGLLEFNLESYDNKIIQHQYTPYTSDYLTFLFISNGGLSGIDITKLRISDDTILHLANCRLLLENITTSSDIMDKGTKIYVKTINDILDRDPGKNTLKVLLDYKNGADWKNNYYSLTATGSGVSMRSMIFGLCFSNNITNLIVFSLYTARLTHNHIFALYSGVICAYMTYLALTGIELDKWIDEIIKLLESKKIEKFIDFKFFGIPKEQGETDIEVFKDFWHKYKELRFVNGHPVFDNTYKIPGNRTLFYVKNFSLNPEKFFNPGSNAVDSLIITYDCLLYARNSWEKIIYYSIVHVGDSDTTGSITCSLFGLIHGIKQIPKNHWKGIEKYNDMISLAKKLYERYK